MKQDIMNMNSIIKYNEPKEPVYDPYFALAERLCVYAKISHWEGSIKAWRYKLAKDELSRIIRNIFADEDNFMHMCELIIDKESVNKENLEAFLEEQNIKDVKLKEILRRALPVFVLGGAYQMKEVLEPLVGEGLPNPEDIKYDYLAFPRQPEKHMTD